GRGRKRTREGRPGAAASVRARGPARASGPRISPRPDRWDVRPADADGAGEVSAGREAARHRSARRGDDGAAGRLQTPVQPGPRAVVRRGPPKRPPAWCNDGPCRTMLLLEGIMAYDAAPVPPQALPPRGINHMVLNVRTLEVSHKFWTEITGVQSV